MYGHCQFYCLDSHSPIYCKSARAGSGRSHGNGLRPCSRPHRHIHERETSYTSRDWPPAHHACTNPPFANPTSEPDVETGPLLADTCPAQALVPVVASWCRGIPAASVPLTPAAVERRMRAREFEARCEEWSGGEAGSEGGDVEDQHGWAVGGIQLHPSGERAVTVVGWVICSRALPRNVCRRV